MSAQVDVFCDRYDRVYSLGQWCATAILLRKCGLRAASGPFDWFKPKADRPYLLEYLRCLRERFSVFMRQSALRLDGFCGPEGKDRYLDVETGWVSYHDFLHGATLADSYGAFRARLDRRIGRLLGDLDSGRRILFVHFLGKGHYERREVAAAMQEFRAAFPAAHADLLVMESDSRDAEVRYENPAKGISFAVGDFYDASRHDVVMGNECLCCRVLSRIGVRGRWRNLIRLRVASWGRKLRRQGRRHEG